MKYVIRLKGTYAYVRVQSIYSRFGSTPDYSLRLVEDVLDASLFRTAADARADRERVMSPSLAEVVSVDGGCVTVVPEPIDLPVMVQAWRSWFFIPKRFRS